jgi:UDP:flavonoid glycosyltransferase YjiC (YdhE family)
MIDVLVWQGLGDIINRFRVKVLGLEPVGLMWASGMLDRLKVPHAYCWSSTLIHKPDDWADHITISGSYLLSSGDYTPSPKLQAFLDAGPPPFYVGFGSIVLDDPRATTKLMFEVSRQTGQRLLLFEGPGGMHAVESDPVPDTVFMLSSAPHDWLFQQVSCVVHHGGAGTTMAGIAAGRPTLVVPFFGDQAFWGAMIARAGAGPTPIPQKQLTAERLVEAIDFCLRPETLERAK